MGNATIAMWQESTNHGIFHWRFVDDTNPRGGHPIFSLVTANLNSFSSIRLEFCASSQLGVTSFSGNQLFLISWITTLLIRMSILQLYRNVQEKAFKSTPTKSRRTETCSTAISSKNSNKGESMQCRTFDNMFVHCSVEKYLNPHACKPKK